MRNLTVEYLRFGDPTGVLRLSDRYIRSVGTTQPTDEVSFGVPQENLARAMAYLDYGRFRSAGEGARDAAERVLTGLAPHVERFLFSEGLPVDDASPLQIDIVTRALELAQLPFEVVEEARPRLIVTRRIRQPWPPPAVVEGHLPKILFAWAEPSRMDVPHDRHRALLEDILTDLGGAKAIVEVPHATGSKLSDALDGRNAFTHLHVLVHGLPHVDSGRDPLDLGQKPPPSVMLALETEDGKLDRRSPDDLAGWLARGPKPQVATIATCHSGEVNPIHAGGTIAHTLHAAGVPVVLASQLALTKDGSDYLLRVFLERVIEGEDPRRALRDCRDTLRKDQANTYYDRVALVGYIHLESDIEKRLKERRFRVAFARLKKISADAQGLVKDIARTPELTEERRSEAERIPRRFQDARAELAKLEGDRKLSKAQREELLGLQASSLKREAEATWAIAGRLTGQLVVDWQEHSRSALRAATKAYARAAKVSRDHHWTWVQWLALLAVQNEPGLEARALDWEIASRAAGDAARREPSADDDDGERREAAEQSVWAWGSLCELHLLGPLFRQPVALDEAKACLARLVAGDRGLGKRDAIEATRDQLARYEAWWGRDATWKLPAEIFRAATELRQHLDDLDRQPT